MSCLLMCDLHASGYDALINFHTRPTYRGSEFNIGGNTWIRPDGVNGRGRDFNKTSPWADFTYTEDKWNVQADASWQWEQSGMSTYTTRTFPLNNYEERMLEQDLRDPTDLMRRRSLALETAVDYRINDRHIVSALVGVSTTGFDRTLKSRMVTGNINSVLRDTIGHMSRLIENNYLGWAFGIYHRGLVGKWNINTSLTYNTSAWDYKRNVSRTSGYSVDDLRRKSSDYFWGNFSAYRTLFGGKAGLDLSETLLSMDYKEKRLGTDIVLSNNSVISSTTYASLQYFPSNKLSLTANVGVFVYHNSEGDTHTTSVKPRLQANAFWRPSKKFVTQLVYSASSSSPNLIQMSGYGQFTDSLEYQSGNPSLKATTTHSVMLNLTFFSSLTGTTARYMNYRREKWIPTADWYMIYRVAPIAMDCVLSYGIIGSSSITPQSRYWELRDGFGLALQKNFLNNRLQLSVLWSPDIHFMPGKTHTYR